MPNSSLLHLITKSCMQTAIIDIQQTCNGNKENKKRNR